MYSFIFLVQSAVIFQINFFKNNSFSRNGLDPDQDLHFVCPDLDPSCLQRLSADDTSHHLQVKSLINILINLSEASSTVRALDRALVSVIITLLNDSERSLNKNGGAQ